MTVVTGQRHQANVASAQRYIDIAKEIMELEPSAAPLTVVTSRMNKKQTGETEYSWMESEREVEFDAINNGAGYTSTEEELKVDTEEVFAVNQLIVVPRTSEILFVKELKGSSKIKVERGAAGTTKAALVDNDPLFVIGQAAEQGQTSFSGRSINPVKITNYTGIFRTSMEATGTWGSSQNQTSPHDWVFQHRNKNREHLITIEKAGLFGHKSSGTGPGGKPFTTTGGLLSFYLENNQDAGGTLTESELETWVRTLCRYGSDIKTLFCSPLLLSVINNFAVGRLQTIQADMDSTYGLKVTKYQCAHGELNLVKHNLLQGATWGGYGIAVDYKAAPPEYRPLGGGPFGSRDTKLLTNRQENDRDGQRDEILTEVGFGWPQPKTGGVLTGVTG